MGYIFAVSYTHLNRLQWKRVLTDATGWNNPKNCELWRSEWAKVCNEHLPLHNPVSYTHLDVYKRQSLNNSNSFKAVSSVGAAYTSFRSAISFLISL